MIYLGDGSITGGVRSGYGYATAGDVLSLYHTGHAVIFSKNEQELHSINFELGAGQIYAYASIHRSGQQMCNLSFTTVAECSTTDGTSLSKTYPCLCGSATCTTDQICTSATDQCQELLVP